MQDTPLRAAAPAATLARPSGPATGVAATTGPGAGGSRPPPDADKGVDLNDMVATLSKEVAGDSDADDVSAGEGDGGGEEESANAHDEDADSTDFRVKRGGKRRRVTSEVPPSTAQKKPKGRS